MKQIIDLLHERNKYLEQFYTVNKRELTYLEKGIFKNIKVFYEDREDILKSIDKVNNLISKFFSSHCDNLKFEEKTKIETLKASKYKDHLVNEILHQNLKILSFIEEMKTDMIKDVMGLAFSKEDMRLRFEKRKLQFSNKNDEEYL